MSFERMMSSSGVASIGGSAREVSDNSREFTSWGKARMYSYIMGGPTRKYDEHITKKYNVIFKD